MTGIALPSLGAARVSGPDAGSFLQAQLSADIAALQPGDATFACYCSARGQVFGLLLACRDGDGYLLAGGASLLPGMLQRLRMYVLRSRVELATAPELAVLGHRAANGGSLFRPASIDLAYSFVEPAAEVEDSSGREAASHKARELRNGVAWLGPQTTERFIPQMLGFDRIGAVSFRKGCYPGQEIVARARYLGKVKRGPLLLTVAGDPAAGAGATLRLAVGDAWQEASLIDSVAVDDGRTLMLMVTVPPPSGVREVAVGDRSYRCATM